MKITGTRSYIKIEFEEKVIKIKGELLVGGFVAYKDSIKNWEPPHESEKIDDLEKQRIIDMVINETKNSHLVITFE
ncbi:Imm74 family immunity protein [Pectinatus frisingensis]|uniref:Imm74 family immunity protein n=1 Tax=Pectinatus frisingensis TaxID=865 RepID=UPI0018C74793|nr:Imm74 family immunity protein [Pectinatus frisingensis]